MSDPQPRMRADARENRERILEATRQLLVEHGPDVPLDQIAARAGTSIATLYRRFEDRTALFSALVAEESAALLAAMDDLDQFLGQRPDREEWESAMHDLIVSSRSRLAPVVAAINSGVVGVTEEMMSTRARLGEMFARIVSTAQEQGLVRDDITHQEAMTLLMAANQPNPHLDPEQNRQLAGRMIAILLAGLSPAAAGVPLRGTPFHLEFDRNPRTQGSTAQKMGSRTQGLGKVGPG